MGVPTAMAQTRVPSLDNWYVVQTKPRCEERARYWLDRQARLPVFMPKVAYPSRRRSRRVTVVEPLFPSYLFVQMCPDLRLWDTVRWTPGVKRIVTTGDTPTPMPPEGLRLLLERCGDGDIVAWKPRLQSGGSVRIIAGPFAGLVGVLERPCSRSDRVRVLLNLLGTVTPVEIDVVDIEVLN
jgi:transcriptional antiterminator RfaH